MSRIADSSARFFSSSRQPLYLAAALCLSGSLLSGAEEPPVITALRQRVEVGDPEAMTALADAFANGDGVAKNQAQAFRYYNQAAALGDASALFSVAVMMETGQGTSLDMAEAFRTYVKAAELGWAPAQAKVGDMFESGVGTTRDPAAAVSWYRKAAANGMAEAQFNLAVAYEQGRGVAKDRDQAQHWYREAADRGYVRARFNLALMLESGLGSSSDAVAAAELYRTAAERGFAPAQNNYGLLLAEGRGSVPTNLVESFAWLTIAVENGANPAGRNLVAKKLNPAQLAAAQQRAAELRTQLSSGNGSAVEAAPPTTSVLEHAPLPELEKAGPVVRAAPAGAETSSLKAEILALTAEIKDLSMTNDGLRQEQGKWVQENLRLAAALRAAETALAAARTTSSPDSAALVKERDSLQAQLSEAVGKLAVAEQRIAQLEPLEARGEAAQTQLAALATQNDELTKRLDALTQENQTMRQEQAAFVEKYEQLAAGSDSSSKSALVAAAEWAAERETLRSAMHTATSGLAAAEQQIAQLKQERDTALEAITAARTQAETASVELAALSAQGLRVSELTASLENLTRENAALREQLERLDAPRAESAFVAESPGAAPLVEQDAPQRESIVPPLAETQEKLAALERQTAGFASSTPPQEAGRRFQPTRPRQAIALSTLRIRDTADALNRIAMAANSGNRNVTGVAPRGVQQMSVSVPSSRIASGRASRIHTVAKGETLTRISVRYYGTGDRWQEIYHANREDLRGQTTIRIGQLLLVP